MRNWTNFEFESPLFLYGLLLIPILAVWFYISHKKSTPALRVTTVAGFKLKKSVLAQLKPLLYVLKLAAVALLIVALARPRNVAVSKKTKSNKGIDIVMAIDVSGSMLAKDLQPNRLEALKDVAKDFVSKRPNDRIGIVVYAGESFTQTPITSDKGIVTRTISDIEYGQIEDGTAIGMGLGSAINRLKDSKAKSKVIILLTDGVNTAGFIDPRTATELAKELNIKVYTIGIGTNGMAPFPYAKDRFGRLQYRRQKVEIDEDLLKHIASETSGQYFRATNNSKLQSIYDEINKLEKTKIEEFKYYNYQEEYRLYVLIALGLLLLEYVLRNTLFKSFI
ncbi:vWA domain-containing protein [Flavicella marina]|uniref:vWA domain-containing protein n=1 Tax=Flavicella marina TaxID=1475951 RepID=UPI0012643E6D|nr:VWA domain-containing protein [Flavicella marina]